MNASERRTAIIKKLQESRGKALSGKALSDFFGVSRQVIVQDIAILRAEKFDIVSTTSGYVYRSSEKPSRVFKVRHTDAETEEECNIFVDYGGTVEDVFIYHKVYGIVRAELDLRNREDIRKYMMELSSGRSSDLKNITSGYHYHTVSAGSEKILDLIQEKLSEKGFLARLQEFEPVDFWGGK